MLDHDKYQNLHTIIMLRDVIRKWWRVELSFADKSGQILDRPTGEPSSPPQNDFCRLSLFCKEGNRRCGQSVRVLVDRFRASRKVRHCLGHECHLGLQIVGAPLYMDGEFEGCLFVEGFAHEAPTVREAEVLKAKIGELNRGATDLDRAVERIPLLGSEDHDKLTDLLDFAVHEVENFKADLGKREEAAASEGGARGEVDIVGKSAPMLSLFRLVEKVCQSDATVLINGESGTGKELVARAIHTGGPRKAGPFVVQNCSAFNDNLLESALFGHVKGAFTGAVRDRKGLFEIADGGSFFLDEVGDMSPTLQVKLLRVLQEGTFLPVGGTATREVDVRVIAATHKNLAKLVERGEFREDLYYRINVIRIEVPPLRERRDDLPLLVDHFLRKHARPGTRCRALSSEAMRLLEGYGWPGNIRELENEVERLLVLGGDSETIPAELLSTRIRDGGRPGLRGGGPGVAIGNLPAAVELLEREMIQQGLARLGGNRSQLARELGISRSNLILKIQKYGLGSTESWSTGAA